MGDDSTAGLPEDPWDELIHQGDVFEESVGSTPAIVNALERGTDDAANWLYVLAAMCVGRPEDRAARIREEARHGAATYRRLLESRDTDECAAAIGALTASGAADEGDRRRFAALVRSDAESVVRAHATLALGLEVGFEAELHALLDDGEAVVRHAAALALARPGDAGEEVVRVLAEGLLDDDAEAATALPPWDELYPGPEEAFAALGEAAAPAIPALVARLETEETSFRAVDLADVLLELAGRNEERRRDVVRRLVENDAAWERALDLEGRLARHRLPERREELRGWLAGRE